LLVVDWTEFVGDGSLHGVVRDFILSFGLGVEVKTRSNEDIPCSGIRKTAIPENADIPAARNNG
jgi:hypothetical protein